MPSTHCRVITRREDRNQCTAGTRKPSSFSVLALNSAAEDVSHSQVEFSENHAFEMGDDVHRPQAAASTEKAVR